MRSMMTRRYSETFRTDPRIVALKFPPTANRRAGLPGRRHLI